MSSGSLPDIQDSFDDRGIELDQVGIASLRYPLMLDDGVVQQSVIADLSMTVRLPAHRRGTHMSRMIELVDEQLAVLRPHEVPVFLKSCASRLDVSSVSLKAALSFATRVSAPVTGTASTQVHDLVLSAILDEGQPTMRTTVIADVTSLCPCSKAISEYGAHNQRSRIALTVLGMGDAPYPLPITEAADRIRSVGSCPVYPTIKRSDERAVTMAAYDKPAFVEDIARDLSLQCRELELDHRIEVRNLESIHSHDAFAVVEYSHR